MNRLITFLALVAAGLALAPAVLAAPCLARDRGCSPAVRSLPALRVAGESRAPATSAPAAPMRHVGLPGLPFRGPDLLEGMSEQSYNWAGYDATGGGFTSVTATWVQPAIAPSAAETYAAFWAGLDGDGSSTVEQTGTLAYSENGKVYYEAWYEMYPAAMKTISLTISPGDSLTATVTSKGGGKFTLDLSDNTTGQNASESASNTSAEDYSAEVIAEAPSSGTSILPLANFGTVDFTGCSFNGEPISAFPWNQIDMVSSGSDGSTLAATSALGADGASFSVSTAPTLSGFTPTSGQVGSSVTLTGSGFSPATAVSFNGTAAAFTVNSDTKITATVPSGATSGAITVTTPAGTATSAASFTVTALSGDDSLSALAVSAGSLSPAFASATLSYTDSVANSVTSVSVTATPTNSKASYALEVGGAPVTNPIALSVGANPIDIVVSAQDGAQQTYSLTVNRAAALSGDDSLSALAVSAGSLSPAFASATLSYTDSVANSVTSVSVTATPTNSKASYALEVGGAPVTNPIALSVGANPIDIVVSAQDGAQQTYSLTVNRAAAPIQTPALTLELSGLKSGTLQLGKRLTVKGTVTPTSLAGGTVTFTVQRKHDGKWLLITSRVRTIGSGGAYGWTYKPAQRGSYRIKATIAKTVMRTATTTKWLTFKVK